MQTKKIEITTTTHAIAVGLYISQSVLGCLYVLHLAVAKSMTDITNPFFVDFWAFALFAAGATATAAVLSSKTNPLPALKVEMIAALALSGLSLWYEITLVISNGFVGVVTTQTYAVMVAIACFFRAVQIQKERRRVFRTLKSLNSVEG